MSKDRVPDRVQTQVRSPATAAGLGKASLQLPGLRIKVITSQHPNVNAPSTALFGFKMKNKFNKNILEKFNKNHFKL